MIHHGGRTGVSPVYKGKGEHILKDRDNNKVQGISGNIGLEIRCNRCGQELPLLHPHIILEKSDDSGEAICEECYFSEDIE